jgi:hypothetical protein
MIGAAALLGLVFMLGWPALVGWGVYRVLLAAGNAVRRGQRRFVEDLGKEIADRIDPHQQP